TASEDDALPRVAERGFGDWQWPGRGSGATLGGRTIRLRRNALGPSEGRSPAAFALHRIKRRLAKVRPLVPRQNPSTPEEWRTTQNPHQSTINPQQSSVTTMLGIQLHSKELAVKRAAFWRSTFVGFPDWLQIR